MASPNQQARLAGPNIMWHDHPRNRGKKLGSETNPHWTKGHSSSLLSLNAQSQNNKMDKTQADLNQSAHIFTVALLPDQSIALVGWTRIQYDRKQDSSKTRGD